MSVKRDVDLLYLVSENARATLKDLAKQLHKTPQRINYAVKQLHKEGLLKTPYALIDYARHGLLLFRTYHTGAYISAKDKEAIIKELMNNSAIASVAELTGPYDVTLEFLAPNPSRFNKDLKKLIAAHTTLSDYTVLLNIVTHVYPRNYLPKSLRLLDNFKERVIGGDREAAEYSKHDIELLKHLLNKPTMRLSHLARLTHLHPKTVKSYVRQLEENNIVKGCKYELDSAQLGIVKTRLLLKLHNFSADVEARLATYCKETKEIIQLNKTIGNWDVEIDIESWENSTIRKIIHELRENFKESIQHFNLIEINTVHKKTYLPMDYYKEDTDGAAKTI